MAAIATNYHYYFVRKIVMPKWMVVELWQGDRLIGVADSDNLDAGCDS